ncbi:hypothetical protein PV433_27425 [Paenibacillus sp. GYB004]|uniref:hypothetical protein n=1 Tax=Paenibacillus sp. GYB004 TaxID=2994393 RepID=UPI002F969F6F
MYGAMAQYKLTPEEIELAKNGQLYKIRTADQRGIKFEDVRLNSEEEPAVAEPILEPEPEPEPAVKKLGRDPYRYGHITKELLQQELELGKTLVQISEALGITFGSMSWLLKKYELSGNKRGPKSKKVKQLV